MSREPEKLLRFLGTSLVTVSGLTCAEGGAGGYNMSAVITVLITDGEMLDWVKLFVGGVEATPPNLQATSPTYPYPGVKVYQYDWQHQVSNATDYTVEARAKVTLSISRESGGYTVTCPT